MYELISPHINSTYIDLFTDENEKQDSPTKNDKVQHKQANATTRNLQSSDAIPENPQNEPSTNVHSDKNPATRVQSGTEPSTSKASKENTAQKESSHGGHIYPSVSCYDGSGTEFNFRHGYGAKDSGTHPSDFRLCEKSPEISKSGLEACLDHLNDVHQKHPSGFEKNVLDMYPEINPDFQDPTMAIPVRESDPLIVMLSLQLILLACGAFSSGMSDNQISFQLGFMRQFLASCASFGFASQQLASEFPGTLYKFKQWLGIADIKSKFTRKVVCPKPSCCKLYDFNECYSEDRYGNRFTKTCNAEVYKNRSKTYCEEPLLQYDSSSLGNRVLKPRKEFLMRSIADQIEEKLKRKGMEEACQRWRNDLYPVTVRKDIHTGNTWKMLQHEHKYFKTDHELALQYNIDWWQPHENSNKSLGVMYFAICNLPREIRYKRENLIIGGVIPSLDFSDGKTTRTEPELLDSFQDPIVDELSTLWRHGAKIETYNHPDGVQMRAALLLNSSDCPAARKSSGFLAHSANYGCNYCFKKFPGKVGEKYYGGFNDVWPERSMDEHR